MARAEVDVVEIIATVNEATATGADADVLASFPSPSYREAPGFRQQVKDSAVFHLPNPPPSLLRSESGAFELDEASSQYVSRSDIQMSVDAFKDLVAVAEGYTTQMSKLAAESARFAQALENIARSDLGDSDDGAGLQACAGLHYLLANQLQVLSEATKIVFHESLKEHCREYETKVKHDEVEYRQTVAALGEAIRQTEGRSYQMGRRGKRDLTALRVALVDITRQVEELEAVKAAYYRGVRDARNLSLALILQAAGAVVRAEVDVFERISQKGFTDPILEPMIVSVPDPFESYPTANSGQLFSVLPPLLSMNSDAFALRGQSFVPEGNVGSLMVSDAAAAGDFSHGETASATDARGILKHDSGTVNAFVALFGAKANEVLNRQRLEDFNPNTVPGTPAEVWSRTSAASLSATLGDQQNGYSEGPMSDCRVTTDVYTHVPIPAAPMEQVTNQGLLRFEGDPALAASAQENLVPALASSSLDTASEVDESAWPQRERNVEQTLSGPPSESLLTLSPSSAADVAARDPAITPDGTFKDGLLPHSWSPDLPRNDAYDGHAGHVPPSAALSTAPALSSRPPSGASESSSLDISHFDFRHPPTDRPDYSILAPDSEVD